MVISKVGIQTTHVGRFESYGWHVVEVDGHDADAIQKAIDESKAVADKPSLICCKTIIGKGSPNKSGSHDCHGAALGDDEVALVRKEINWPHDPFVIPDDVYEGWNQKDKGAAKEAAWNEKFAAYAAAFPAEAKEFTRRMAGELPADWKSVTDAKSLQKQTIKLKKWQHVKLLKMQLLH